MTPEQKEAYDYVRTAANTWLLPQPFANCVRTILDALAASQPAPAADTGQAVAWDVGAQESDGRTWLTLRRSDGASAMLSCKSRIDCGNETIVSQVIKAFAADYTPPAPLDAERVREAWAYRVHDFHIARSPVKARAKFPEATEHLYPASRHADAIEMARLLGGTCTPLYPPEDAR